MTELNLDGYNPDHDESGVLADLGSAVESGQRVPVLSDGRPVAYIVPAEQGIFLDEFEKGRKVAIGLGVQPAAPGPDWRDSWTEVPVDEPKLNIAALSVLLGRMIELSGVSPRVLGVPDGDGSVPERIDRMLRDG